MILFLQRKGRGTHLVYIYIPLFKLVRILVMVLIRDVVKEVLTTGYLTLADENQLRKLLRTKYDKEDLNAFMSLQEAAMNGLVKQEARLRLE